MKQFEATAVVVLDTSTKHRQFVLFARENGRGIRYTIEFIDDDGHLAYIHGLPDPVREFTELFANCRKRLSFHP